jgi:hypothetical protein
VLEDHAHPRPDGVHVCADVGDVPTLEPDVPERRAFEEVGAAKEGRFPASRGSDYDLDLTGLQREVDAPEDVVIAEPLVDPF